MEKYSDIVEYHERLKEINTDLLEALKKARSYVLVAISTHSTGFGVANKNIENCTDLHEIDAAIAAAEGEE